MKSAGLWLAGAVMAAGGQGAHAPVTTPPGIGTASSIVGEVFTNGQGLTLYADMKGPPGKVTCTRKTLIGARVTHDCLAIFHPLAAPEHGVPAGEWTVITRPDDGARQWAYRNWPVYTSEFDSKPGSANGESDELQAVRTPLAMPPGIGRRYSRFGEILTTVRGTALYAVQGDDRAAGACTLTCIDTWRPVYAPALANPVGDFNLVTREDGTKQWSYKGMPLQTYAGDVNPGDTAGDGLQSRQPVVIQPKEPVPAGVIVTQSVRGDVFANAQGRTLYYYVGIYPNENGKPVRDFRAVKPLCEDECGKLWRPVPVKEGAKLSPSWMVFDLVDGTKQLGYRGRPLYTYAGDQEAGDIDGSRYGRQPGEFFMPVLANTKLVRN